ncbi:MAG: hypothetical protein HYZ65_08090 [Burkholderiales bacterium]|nr:hypothetical protein [Burkholderiales bacterium]
MDDTSRRKFESIFQLYSHAWGQFNARRVYEWQICIVFWTALALSVAGVVNANSLPVIKEFGIVTMVLTGIILLSAVALHFWFVHGLTRAHKIDRLIGCHYGELLQKLTESEFSEDFQKELGDGRKRWEHALNWSTGLQLGVSLLLSISLFVLIYGKINVPVTEVKEVKITASSPIAIFPIESKAKDISPHHAAEALPASVGVTAPTQMSKVEKNPR